MSQRLYIGDAIETLAGLAEGSVDLVVTSPPFLALRTYNGDSREVGQERSPAEYLDRLLAVTAACGRVLTEHGSLCVELGDTFSGSGGAGGDYGPGGLREGQPLWKANRDRGDRRTVSDGNRPGGHHAGGPGWPPAKSLCLIPHLYAAALAYGFNPLTGEPSPAGQWKVRNMICWARHPPPGSVGDKFRVGTSYITVATRSRTRYFDMDAVAMPAVFAGAKASTVDGARTGRTGSDPTQEHDERSRYIVGETVPPLDWHVDNEPEGDMLWRLTNHRGARSPITASDVAHYATFPEELPRRLILAMCPPGGVVLDPFVGSGTTMAAAQGVGRSSIGIDLDGRMAELVHERVGMFLEVD